MPTFKQGCGIRYMENAPPIRNGIRGLTNEQEEKFIALSARELHQPKCPDVEALETLGLRRDCDAMAARLGISTFFHQPKLSLYSALTWEFLAIITRSNNRPSPRATYTFRLCNAEHTLTLND